MIIYEYQKRSRRDNFKEKLFAIGITIGVIAIGWLVYQVFTFDYCPLWYGIECVI